MFVNRTSINNLYLLTVMIAALHSTAAAATINSETLFGGQQQQRQLQGDDDHHHQSCDAASFDIIDHGYNDEYRGWYDPNGCGICNQYCRWVGNSYSGGDPTNNLRHGNSWWSCQTGTSNEQVWKRYDEIASSFPYRKCSSKNEQPISAVSPNPPRIISKENSNGLSPPPPPAIFFNTQTIELGSNDGVTPGQFVVTNVELTTETTGTFGDRALLYLAKGRLNNDNDSSNPHEELTIICEWNQGNGPFCGTGTTTYSDHVLQDNAHAQQPSTPMSHFNGLDPAGEWELGLNNNSVTHNGRITKWTLLMEVMDSNGNRRKLLRGDTSRD